MTYDPKALADLVRFVRARSPFYREAYRDLPNDVTGTAALPVVDHAAFWAANSYEDNALLTGPLTDGLVLKSGGTTGRPKFSVFGRDEWQQFTATFGRYLAKSGLREGDRVANLFFVGELYGSFLFTHKVLEECPVRVLQLPIAGAAPPASLVKHIRDYGATVLAGLPTTLLTLIDQLDGPTAVRLALFAGEPMQADQRQMLSHAFPNLVIASIGYASTDAGLIGYTDGTCGPNEFRCYDGESIFEILDEDTGAVVTALDVPGRAVITALKRRLMPVLRYPVGDRAQWVDPPGTPDRRFLLLGRTEEAARIGAISLFFDDVRALLGPFADRLGAYQFQLVVVHRDARDGLIIRIASKLAGAARAACAAEIIEAVYRNRPMYRDFVQAGKVDAAAVEWREPGGLEANPRTGKLRRVIDERAAASAAGGSS